MKIGLIARADKSGLAVQTWEFWRNMRPAKTMVICPTWKDSGQRADRTMYEGDPNVTYVDAHPYPLPDVQPREEYEAFLEGLDVVFTAETPYNFWLFQRARELGVKTVLQYNYEFLEYLLDPKLPRPDLFAAPSLWHAGDIPFVNKAYLPVPVNRDALPFRPRTELRSILHTAGTPAIHDRNGTDVLMAAMTLLPHDVDVTLRVTAQKRVYNPMPGRIRVDTRQARRYTELYDGDEDLFVMPRKYGGLCLPIQEAMAQGMPVIMPDISPQFLFLPPAALVPATKVLTFMAKAKIDVYEPDPQAIAERITFLYRNPDVLAELSRVANEWAEDNSWETLRPRYLQTFTDLLEGRL